MKLTTMFLTACMLFNCTSLMSSDNYNADIAARGGGRVGGGVGGRVGGGVGVNRGVGAINRTPSMTRAYRAGAAYGAYATPGYYYPTEPYYYTYQSPVQQYPYNQPQVQYPYNQPAR